MREYNIRLWQIIHNICKKRFNELRTPPGYKVGIHPDDDGEAPYCAMKDGKILSGAQYNNIQGALEECWEHSND